MENCIENKHKKFNVIHSKVFAAITMLIVGFVMMMCFACNTNVYAAESNTIDKTQKELYDTEWSKAKISFYCERFRYIVNDQTIHYLRITKEDGKTFINNITHLSASFEISSSGKKTNIKVDKDLSSNRFDSDFFTFGNMLSKEGQFCKIGAYDNKHNSKKKFKDEHDKDVTYEECNYKWMWNWYVTKIVYLYVWYEDPTTGKQVAGSFMPNGEHPLYNEDGTLKGIYDVDNNLMSNMTLNKNGIPSEIIKNADGTETESPLIKWNEQEKGSYTANNIFTFSLGNLFDSSNSFLTSMILVLKLILYVIIIFAIIKFIKFIMGLFK